MVPLLVATVVLLGIGRAGHAKELCPAGAFVIEGPDRSALDGLVVTLQDSSVAIEGVCSAAPSRPRQYGDLFLGSVRTRWSDCAPGSKLVAMSARFARDCRSLAGRFRTRTGNKWRFEARRVPACGNALREQGERCDEGSQNGAEGGCCRADCRVVDGCSVPCASNVDCSPGALCEKTCNGLDGVCRPLTDVACDHVVCGCDFKTYGSRCEASRSGVGVQFQYDQACVDSCRPGDGDVCGRGEYCDAVALATCDPVVAGVCIEVPRSCRFSLRNPECGCDGKTYANRCERRLARVGLAHAGPCSQ